MTFTMSAANMAKLDNLTVSGKIEGRVGGVGNLGVLSLKASGGYDKSDLSTITSYTSTFGMVLIPASIPLALSNPIVQRADQKNITTSYIDCNEWTTRIQEAYDSDKWMAPIQYGFAPISGLLGFSGQFPQCGPGGVGSKLGRVQKYLSKFITSCVYANPSAIALTDGSEISQCPKSRSSICVTGMVLPTPPDKVVHLRG